MAQSHCLFYVKLWSSFFTYLNVPNKFNIQKVIDLNEFKRFGTMLAIEI